MLISDNYDKLFLSLCDGIMNKLHVFLIHNSIVYKVVCADLVSSYCTQNLLPNEQFMFTKFKNLCFAVNCIMFDLSKIFTGFMEWTFRYLHRDFLCDLMVLKFWHKLTSMHR